MKHPAHRPPTALPAHAAQAACKALILRSIELRQWYRHAAAVCEPGLRMVLNDNAQTLDLLVGDLQAQCGADAGKPGDHGSWRGAARRQLASWLVRAAPRRDVAWLRALAHHESALLRAFEQTIALLPADSARALCRQLPRLQGIHQDMHSLVGNARR